MSGLWLMLQMKAEECCSLFLPREFARWKVRNTAIERRDLVRHPVPSCQSSKGASVCLAEDQPLSSSLIPSSKNTAPTCSSLLHWEVGQQLLGQDSIILCPGWQEDGMLWESRHIRLYSILYHPKPCTSRDASCLGCCDHVWRIIYIYIKYNLQVLTIVEIQFIRDASCDHCHHSSGMGSNLKKIKCQTFLGNFFCLIQY